VLNRPAPLLIQEMGGLIQEFGGRAKGGTTPDPVIPRARIGQRESPILTS